MYYDEIIIEGELFYKTSKDGGWIRATNKMLTGRLRIAEANLNNIEELVRRYKK
jgi:hypothetical protein